MTGLKIFFIAEVLPIGIGKTQVLACIGPGKLWGWYLTTDGKK